MNDAIVTSEFAALATTGDQMSVGELIALNTGGAELNIGSLDRLKIPSGGMTAWEVPTIDGDVDHVKELDVVIIGMRNTRVFFSQEYTGEVTQPDCSSEDGITGFDAETEVRVTCATCPHSQWGSKGRGQACSARKLVLALTKDSALPVLVDLSPTSAGALEQYLLRVAGRRLAYYQIETKLKLEKITSGGGIVYSKLDPHFSRILSDDEQAQAASYMKALGGMFNTVTAEAPTLVGEPPL